MDKKKPAETGGPLLEHQPKLTCPSFSAFQSTPIRETLTVYHGENRKSIGRITTSPSRRLRGQKGETMDTRYVVIDMPAPGTDGDIYQEVYTTAEEANAAASYKWHQLSAGERLGRRIMAGVVTRDMLPEEATDEETGAVDWSLFGDCDTFPGAFDSQPSVPLSYAIVTVRSICIVDFADMAADVFESDALYDPNSAAWIVPVNLEDDDLSPRCGEYHFKISKDAATYELYRR